MAEQRDEGGQVLPAEAIAGIDGLVREVQQALARWELLLAPFWENIHIEDPELESEAFKKALADYTYGVDIAGAFQEGGGSPHALGHLAGALTALYTMLEADGITGRVRD
jgi:hypothetical protein